MRVNPAGFLEKQGDIREKRRKFELNLKKQTQFPKGQNEHKVNYKKGIREINWIGHLVKTKPIQSQMPAFGRKSEARNTKYETSWMDAIEKTKPICGRAKLAQSLIWKVIMKNFMLWGGEKTKPIQSQFHRGEQLISELEIGD